ncbi:MAG: hypothetical protein NZ949_05795, partial [Candidatus Kapabacteria bacterium]|nr:hypothetical protein [Candidatus Kapabacteria bacterium]
LGTFGGSFSEALGVAPDGSTVVGRAHDSVGRWRAFRWDAAAGMHDLGTLGGRESEATAVAPSGTVVGRAMNPSLQARAFRWSRHSGMQDLGTFGGTESAAWGIARDSLVIVGWAENADRQARAFRWTSVTGLQDLGTLGGARSEAYGVSADGSVVVGQAENDDRLWRAFRWTAATGMQELGTLGGRESAALALSADGSVVVGWATTQTGDWRAFRWTAATGLQDLNTVYSRAVGRSLLYVARGISADGRYIVGHGINATTGRQEAYLLDTQGGSDAEEPLPQPLALSVEPQPVVGRMGSASYRLPSALWVSLSVVDLLGRAVATLTDGWHSAGVHRVAFPPLPAGTYMLLLRTEHGTLSRPFVVLR